MTIIGHFSDLHSDLTALRCATRIPDVWACTGDFFPNASRGTVAVEQKFQPSWFASVAEEFVSLLHNRPLLWVQGNHDYVDLPTLLRAHGHANATTMTVDKVVEIDGLRIVGFPGIAYIAGEWATEQHQIDLTTLTWHALQHDPHVLLTHSPPENVLNNYPGLSALTGHMCYRSDMSMRAHLFGHCHEHGGKNQRVGDVLCVNSARTLRFVEVTADGGAVVLDEPTE